jgi:hypothetical protein
MSKEAMKLALEALKKFVSTEWTEPFSEYRYDSDTPSENQFRDEVFTAIKALEEALAKQEQGEPVAKVGHLPETLTDRLGLPLSTPLYTTPQQRTWVGLTEQEQGAIMESLNAYGTNLYHFANAIEAKLKEKNNA